MVMEAQIATAARAAAGDLRLLAERVDEGASVSMILGSSDIDPSAARALAKTLRIHAETVEYASNMAANYAERMMIAEGFMEKQAATLARIEKLSLWGLICFWWEGKR